MKDESLVGGFIRTCSLLGAPHLARSAFESFQNPTLFLQNGTIRCLCNHGLYEDVLWVHKKCWISGCPSDGYTFPLVFKACSALRDFRGGTQAHNLTLRTGFVENVVVQTALVDFYAKSGRMETARMVFDQIPRPDVVSWNALISGFSLNGLTEEAFDAFRQIFTASLKPNASTLASVVPLCGHVGCLGICQSLHAYSVKSGALVDESLTPAFISLYASFGDLSIAVDLFESSCGNNVVTWNAIVSAYAQNQKSSEACLKFRQMLRAGLRPNMVSFVSVVSSCEDTYSVQFGESLHTCVIKNGFDNELSVVTGLLSMYAKLGDIKSAKLLFYQMPERNLVTWNSMISGYVRNGLLEACLAAFCEMQFAGFDPNAISVISILSACSKLGSVLLGKSTHAFSLRRGFEANLNVSNALLDFYCDCCQIYTSCKIFYKMDIRNMISWNTMICGFVGEGERKRAVSLVQQMQKEGMDLDMVTLICILSIYNEQESLSHGMIVHGYAIKSGFDFNVSLANALVSMYINCEDLVAGKLLFEVMPERNVISWNALITGYRLHDLQNEVMLLFNQMVKEGQKPNYVTLLNILPICSTQAQGKSIHAHAVRMGTDSETHLITSLISMYSRFGNIDSSFLLFEMGEKRDISLWNVILSVLVQSKNAQKAVGFFSELHRTGMRPDHVTVLSLQSACVQLTDENLANSLMGYVICVGFNQDVAITNAFIDLYARCGNISISRKLFEELLEKNAVSWTTMINAYGLHGYGAEALALLSQMKLSKMKPDAITYLSVLSACSHAGLVDQCKTVFDLMLEEEITPGIEHYTCIVDLLGRTGHLNEAYEIVKRLPCGKELVNLLQSLLGACRVHGNVELGEEIARSLFELDPESSAGYVILHNIYAAAGRWIDANQVRSCMEGRRLGKVPAFSLVEGNKHHTMSGYL